MGSSMRSTKGARNQAWFPMRRRRGVVEEPLGQKFTSARSAVLLAFGVGYACANTALQHSPVNSLAATPSAQTSVSAPPETQESETVEADELGSELFEDAGATASRVREAPGVYRCTNFRPRVCEAARSPVCARRITEAQNNDAGSEPQTEYLNGCLACADPSVVSYVAQRCAPSSARPLSTASSSDKQR